MKRKLRVLAISVVFFQVTVSSAHSQGFIFGLMAGGLLFGGDSAGTSNISILYTAPKETIEKVIYPLLVRQVAIRFDGKGQQMGMSLTEVINKRVNLANNEVLQIVRVINGERNHIAHLWVIYVDKSQIRK